MGIRGDPLNRIVPGGTGARERRERSWIAALFAYVELGLETAVAFALTVGGGILFGTVVYGFVRGLGRGPVLGTMLELLSGLLLVFIFTELISTIRVSITRRSLQVEPFLLVGVVAAIRRLIVVSAEAENVLGTPRFRDVMLEIGVLAATALVLGVTVLLLRFRRPRDEDLGVPRQPLPDPAAPSAEADPRLPH